MDARRKTDECVQEIGLQIGVAQSFNVFRIEFLLFRFLLQRRPTEFPSLWVNVYDSRNAVRGRTRINIKYII